MEGRGRGGLGRGGTGADRRADATLRREDVAGVAEDAPSKREVVLLGVLQGRVHDVGPATQQQKGFVQLLHRVHQVYQKQ